MTRWPSLLPVAFAAVVAVPSASFAPRLGAQEFGAPKPLLWGFATTGLGAAGAGQLNKSGLVQCLRVGGALRVSDDFALQVTGLTSNVLFSTTDESLTDPRPPANNLNGLVASADFLDGVTNGQLGGITSIGLGAFRHRVGSNTSSTYLGIQLGGEDGVRRLSIGDLTAGGYITVLPETHGNTEWMLMVSFGLRVY